MAKPTLKQKLDSGLLTLVKAEPLLFYVLILAHLVPIISANWFVTVDGPAHLYNSKLLLELAAENGIISNFYAFNSWLLPNWTGHFLLAFFLKIVEASLAEKLVLSLYVVSLPLAFRYVLKVLKSKNLIAAYFIFPVTYSFLFYYGFHNFNFGLVFYFLTLALWIKAKTTGFTPAKIAALVLLTLAVYFSHVFVLGFLFITLFVLERDLVLSVFKNGENRIENLKKLLVYFTIVSPALMLSVIYFLKTLESGGKTVYLPLTELLDLISGTSAKAVDYGKEAIFTRWLFWVLTLNLVFGVLKLMTKKLKDSGFLNWFFLVIVSLALLFLLPDYTGKAGLISSRVSLFLYFFVVLAVSQIKLPKALNFINLFVAVYVSIALLEVYTKNSQATNKFVKEIEIASRQIDANSIVYPFNVSDYWLYGHASNYLGANKPLVILNNYEASLNYFPLKWNIEEAPKIILTGKQEGYAYGNKRNGVKSVDYVLILESDRTTQATKKKIEKLLHELKGTFIELELKNTESVRLYKRIEMD